MLRPFKLIFFLLLAATLQSQSLTVDQIYGPSSILTAPPSDFYWNSTGDTVAWVSPDSSDLIALDTHTGRTRTLADRNQVAIINNAALSEIDLDHRLRYDMPAILWSPDNKSLLFDSAGHLYLYSIAHRVARPLATAQPSADDPKFSPNGNYLTYIRNHGLYLRALRSNPKEVPIAPSTDATILNGEADWVYLEELNVRSNYFWSPDSTRIAYLQMNESAVPTYPITDWLSNSSSTTDHPTINEERYPQAGDPNPDVRIGITTIADPTHATRWITLPLDHNNDYIPRFGWLNKQTLWIETLDRAQQHLHLYFADANTLTATVVYTETDTKFLDINYDFTFLPHNQFLRASWQDGHTHLYLYRYDQNSLTTPATRVQQITTGNYDVDQLLGLNDTGDAFFYTSNEGNPLGRQLWQASLDGSSNKRITAPEEKSLHGTHVISFSPDHHSYIDTFSTAAAPETVRFCTATRAGSCTTVWQSTLPDGASFTAPIAVTLTAADGATPLYGWLSLPPLKKPGSIPLVVNPYGGPGEQSVRDLWGGSDELFDSLLAQHGIAVLSVDNRGMSMRGRDFAQAAFHNFGPIQFADQIAALDQVLARYPQLSRTRLGFWGWSFGGTFTLYALSHSPRFTTGIAVAPVTDWRLYDSIYTERYLGTPAADPAAYNAADLLTTAADLHGHLLLAHGTGDDNVHLANTIQYIQSLIEANKPYDLQFFPRKTHSLLGDQVQTQLYTRILQQLETDLK